MGQTGSAQREPSMEEILASIRRIIEDSDTVRSPGESDPEIAEASVMPQADNESSVDRELNAFRAELEDVPAGDFAETAPKAAEIHPFRADIQVSTDIVEDEAFDAGNAVSEDVQPAIAVKPEFTPTPAEAAQPVEQDIKGIVSQATGRQVAAAFGELSEAFAQNRKRSFDEMAEEMLRPMLQDWLDNNLPTLVERLVREEIERVARGS